MEFQPVELPTAVGRVETRRESNRRAVSKRQRCFDVAVGVGLFGLSFGPGVEAVGNADALDGAEPPDQQRERIDAAVVERPDSEERLGAVVPVGDATDVGVGVGQLDGPESPLAEQPTGALLGWPRDRRRRAAECEITLVGHFDQLAGGLAVECERLFGVHVAVGCESGSRNLGVGRVARQVDDQRRVDGSEGGVEIGEGGTVVVDGERVGTVGVEIADAGQREFGVGDTGGVRRRNRPRSDEQTVHSCTARARPKTPPAIGVRAVRLVLFRIVRLDCEHLESPTRVGRSGSHSRAGLKGATRWRKAGDASTAGTSGASDEERSEPPDASASGLSRWFQFPRFL